MNIQTQLPVTCSLLGNAEIQKPSSKQRMSSADRQ